MPTVMRKVGARVALEGEAEYKRALSELQKGNAVLGSEMRKLQAEYRGNTESTEFLTKKGEILERQLLQQKDKVQTLRDALSNAAQKYGESSDKTQEWQIKLNNAETAQYNLEAAIRENNEALQGEEEVMQGLGDTVGDLAGKLGIQLPEGATKALNGMQGLSGGTVAAMGAAVGGIAALVKGVQKLHETTLAAAADADEILTESMTSGLSTQTIQQLKYAENLIDVSYSTISGSLTKLTKNMADAADGNDKLAAKFQQLGVSIFDTDGHLRSSEDVFYDTIDALGQVQNTTERDALAMELFGKSAQDLNPLIIQGSDALRKYAEEAETTGYVLDDSQIAKLGEVDDAYQKMQLQLEAAKKELAAGFAPVSIAAMEAFTNVVGGAVDFVNSLTEACSRLKNSKLAAELRAVADSFRDLIGIEKQYKALSDGTYEGGWYKGSDGLYHANGAGANIAGVTFDSSVGAYFSKGGSRIYGDTEKYFDAETGLLKDAWINPENGQTLNRYVYDAEIDKYWDRQTRSWLGDYTMSELDRLYADKYNARLRGSYGYNASGNDNWRGGLTWVGENGPEQVWLPRGTQILNSQESRLAGGGNVYIEQLVLDASSIKQLNDIYDLVSSARVRSRMA